MTSCASNRRGFSLIELVAVMIVTAIVAAAAIPSLGSLGAARLHAGAARLARDLGYARDAASADALATWAVFDTGAQTCAFRREVRTTPGGAGFASATPMPDPASAGDLVLRFDTAELAGVRIVSLSLGGGTRIGFDWQGRPLAHTGAQMTTVGVITLSGPTTVSIEPRTGLIRAAP